MSNQDFVVLTDRGASSSTFNRRRHWRRHAHLSRDDGDAGNVDVVDDGDDDDDKFSRKETKPQVFTVFRVSCHNTGDYRSLFVRVTAALWLCSPKTCQLYLFYYLKEKPNLLLRGFSITTWLLLGSFKHWLSGLFYEIIFGFRYWRESNPVNASLRAQPSCVMASLEGKLEKFNTGLNCKWFQHQRWNDQWSKSSSKCLWAQIILKIEYIWSAGGWIAQRRHFRSKPYSFGFESQLSRIFFSQELWISVMLL